MQKVFDTVKHEIFSVKLKNYGMRGISNEWFKSFLFDRIQFVSVSGHFSNKAYLKYVFLQGPVLGPILFLIYINDLNHAAKFCEVHHFTDDNNLIHLSKSVNKLSKYINIDLENLINWLDANKM